MKATWARAGDMLLFSDRLELMLLFIRFGALAEVCGRRVWFFCMGGGDAMMEEEEESPRELPPITALVIGKFNC